MPLHSHHMGRGGRGRWGNNDYHSGYVHTIWNQDEKIIIIKAETMYDIDYCMLLHSFTNSLIYILMYIFF